MTKENSTKLKFSKVDYCPACNRKLCKRTTNEESSESWIEFYHKGAEIITESAIIKCVGCKRRYAVNSKDGIIEEIING